MTGIPLAKDLPLEDMPHTLAFALIYRSRIDSFNDLPKDKRPPRNLWDKPHRLSEFLDSVFKKEGSDDSKDFIDFNSEDVE